MRELALFAGAGGGILGGILLGWHTVCAVELDDYCQRVLRQRQEDGHLPRFPIHGDVKTFDGREWRGRVDVVSAGFPCQPFSVAGKQRGEVDERNLWPETIRVIREVGPRYALLENVPGLLAHEYFGTILGELAEAGFDAEWMVLGADDCGAPHRRKRLWILADAERFGCTVVAADSGSVSQREQFQDSLKTGRRGTGATIGGRILPHALRDQLRHEPRRRSGSSGAGQAEPRHDGAAESVAYTEREGQLQPPGSLGEKRRRAGDSGWWRSEPDVGRVVDGCPDRVGKLRALGNMQVPIVAARAFLELRSRLDAPLR